MKLSAPVSRVSVGDLENEHRLLDRQIKKFNHEGKHLTPLEQVEVAQMKKQRLFMKDRLATIGKR
jgi:uncharacterized protein YdcH (DUF465 family)